MKVLSDDEIEKIFQASLIILEETGVAFQQEDALTLFHKNGAIVDSEKSIVKFPSSLVEDLIKKVPKEYTLYHRDSGKSVDIANGTVHFQIGESDPVIFGTSSFRRVFLVVRDPFSFETSIIRRILCQERKD